MQPPHPAQQDLDFPASDPANTVSGPIECLGMTFPNDEARREHFLGLLREGLEELHAKLGGVPFTTVEDAVERMKSVEKWPMEPRMNTDEHRSEEIGIGRPSRAFPPTPPGIRVRTKAVRQG